ncbi:hypothetical protein Bxe_C1227 [Paraburkholderia xenovorans LB400]|uniref:Uncharacterized protein n=1 Tax=Paraburkholderia xenovorans (strain LB400) TaxID=266265 RepID=Q13FQ2_PARXL|nr:hypothetical protein Bxe_C1227 [Paraburkholderia xenovorans LB400]
MAVSARFPIPARASTKTCSTPLCPVFPAIVAFAAGTDLRRHEHTVERPDEPGLVMRCLQATHEARTVPVGPAPDRFVTDDHLALDIDSLTPCRLDQSEPTRSATNDGSRKAAAVT